MKTKIILLLITASCTIAAGCRTDRDVSAEPGAAEAGVHEAHVHETNVHEEPSAKTVTGRVSGFDCAVVGELCPTTHRGGDYTTGVYTDDESFYFVVNIPQSFLTQYFLETIEVEGRTYDPYHHAVEPEVIRLYDGDQRRLVYESGYFIDDDGRRATFHEGRVVDGRWVTQ